MYNVKIVAIDELDIQEWNDLLLRSEVCDAFQTYEWAQVLRNSMNMQPLFLIVQEKGENIGGALFVKKKMFRVLDCYEIRGGPVYVGKTKSIIMEQILKALHKLKRRSIYVLFIPFPLINCSLKQMFRIKGYNPIAYRTIILDLNGSLDNTWKALHDGTRRAVKKAGRLGVEVTTASTWLEWKEYYNLHLLHSRGKYPSYPDLFFKEMFKLHGKDMSRLFVAKLEKRIIGGLLCLVYRKNLVCIEGGQLDDFRKYQSFSLLLWKSIEWAKENGVTIYDIHGLPWEKTKYLHGVYQYKKGWDGHIQWFYYYLNNWFLCSGVHLIRTSFLAWRLFTRLRGSGVV